MWGKKWRNWKVWRKCNCEENCEGNKKSEENVKCEGKSEGIEKCEENVNVRKIVKEMKKSEENVKYEGKNEGIEKYGTKDAKMWKKWCKDDLQN